jgi:hypothetical protein
LTLILAEAAGCAVRLKTLRRGRCTDKQINLATIVQPDTAEPA